MQKFEFTLPNEKRKLYNRFALLLFILTAAAVCIKYFLIRHVINKNISILLTVSAFLLLVYQFLIAYNHKVTPYIKAFTGAAFGVALYWFYLGPWWVGLLCVVLTLFYISAQRELRIEVDEARIIYPSFPRKIIMWNELNNLILKDGLLTIDFKNDKIIQHYHEPKMNQFSEQEFNEFCRKQLTTSN